MTRPTKKIKSWPPSPKEREAIYRRDRFRCAYCGRDLASDPSDASIDHIIARHNGGDVTAIANLVTACRRCNSSKNCKDLDHWITDQDLFARFPELRHGRTVRPLLTRREIKKNIRTSLARRVRL